MTAILINLFIQSLLNEVKLFQKVASPWLQVQLKYFKGFLWSYCLRNHFYALNDKLYHLANPIWIGPLYFLLCNKKSRFDFADELKVGYVRYKHLTQITIKVQLFWRLAYEMLLYSKTNRLWVISDLKKVVE